MEVCGSGLLSLLINLVNRNKSEIKAEIKVTIKKKSLFESSILAPAVYNWGDHSQSWVALISCMKKNILKQ